MVVAVTGHRPNKLNNEYDMKGPMSRKIFKELEEIVFSLKPSKMITGMALGVDMLWAILAIKKHIPFVAAIPFEGQESKWPMSSKLLYRKILARATEVVVVSTGGYTAWKMQKRNEWMVDNSNVLVAVWDGTSGGTANCVEYAKDKIDIKRIDPRTL